MAKKDMKKMSTPELAREAFRLLKQCKKKTAAIERDVAKLAAMLGVQVTLVKEKR